MKKSNEINELSKALCESSKEIKNILQNKINPFHNNKYADLNIIIGTVKPILAQNGLNIIQEGELQENNLIRINTLLLHVSGQYIETYIYIPAEKQDRQGNTIFNAQTIGAALTYGRRYALGALLNIATDEDEDGNNLVSKAKEINFNDFIKKIKEKIESCKTIDDLTSYYKSLDKKNTTRDQAEQITQIFAKAKEKIKGEK